MKDLSQAHADRRRGLLPPNVRLRNRALRAGQDLGRMLQVLVLERFLERAFLVLGDGAVLPHKRAS